MLLLIGDLCTYHWLASCIPKRAPSELCWHFLAPWFTVFLISWWPNCSHLIPSNFSWDLILPYYIKGKYKWPPTPVLLPGESHGQRSPVGYSPRACRVRHDWVTNTFTLTFHIHSSLYLFSSPLILIHHFDFFCFYTFNFSFFLFRIFVKSFHHILFHVYFTYSFK